ncbi:rhomboid family intramembrane serine protease [Sediminicola luteus]|uniref:Rhomboid family intramembrane serine protease n=1 Tax=Sediminicola luteus TaxID=319238 RepID=A0A2A4G9V0_9FLAO|nr:rhomboid family intramembrane serine protease [Sediminicola luteus]PCE64545.1 rhomboid family intramembrane serine protease [Sediminicola luteus]
MEKKQGFGFSNKVLVVPMVLVITIWSVFWMELALGVDLAWWGVKPRTFSGLKGVLTSPFVHGSLEHLYNNSLPLIVLSAALVFFYRPIWHKVLFWGWLGSGMLTWVIGRDSFHIGASGVIYMLVSFIFFKGIRQGNFRLVALSLMVVFLYGSMFWYMFPIEEGISWEGHLAGFITGFVLSRWLDVQVDEPKKFAWEKEDYQEEEDPFMRQFDENGNFFEIPKPETEEVEFRYVYKPEEE